MNTQPSDMPASSTRPTPAPATAGGFRPLRVWIPLLLLALMAVARFVPGMVQDGPSMIWMASAFGPLLAGLGIVLWWLLLSRARWSERGVGLLGLILIFAAIVAGVDPSMRGPLTLVMTLPMGIAAFAIGVCLLGHRLSFQRTWIGLLFALLAASWSLLLQNFGTRGDFAFELDWRWNETAEQQFLADKAAGQLPTADESAVPAEELIDPPWPGFRGPQRDSAYRGAKFADEWSSPPEELWRIKVGPAWSSFAVAGNYLFTQEQRGEEEVVVCYRAADGHEVWANGVQSRFFEALGGLGPRGTPTLADGRLYAMGAEGYLRCLHASDGSEVWRQDLREVAQVAPPMWGFSSSPLVVDGIVAVHVGGEPIGVAAFDAASGQLRWSAAAGKQSYSSFQPVRLADQFYVAILTDEGAQLFEPKSGELVLEHAWKHSGYRALQAQLVDENKLLIPTGMGSGTRLVELTADSNGQLHANELWTSREMKPDFNDLVVHDGYIYGFDDRIFACISLVDGQRQWKRGRYGKGQVLLLADSGLLLVMAESGEIALLRADPGEYQELAKFEALGGKTWNHPVVVGDRLFVRNAQEAACYRLPLAAN